jgi:hypothetical protein
MIWNQRCRLFCSNWQSHLAWYMYSSLPLLSMCIFTP